MSNKMSDKMSDTDDVLVYGVLAPNSSHPHKISCTPERALSQFMKRVFFDYRDESTWAILQSKGYRVVCYKLVETDAPAELAFTERDN